MAGGGIKINNIKVSGGADGATFVPSVDANGNLSWVNNKGLPNPVTINLQGPKGDDGKDGKNGEGVYLQNLIFQGKDDNGGNIYRLFFSDGSEYDIVAPKGEKGEKGEVGEGSGIRTLETVPTTTTEGFLGEIVQVSDGTAYICRAITGGNYTWTKLIRANDYATQGTTNSPSAGDGKTGVVRVIHQYQSGLKLNPTNGSLSVWSPPNDSSDNIVTSKYPNVPVSFNNIARAVQYALSSADTFTSYKPAWTDTTRQKARHTLGIYTHNITITFNNEAGIEFNLNFEIHNSQKTAYTEISQIIDLALIPKRSSGSGGEPIYPIIAFWDTGFAFVSLGVDGTLSTNAQFVQFSNCTFVDTVI